jgi:hypothetical protein
MCVRFVNTEFLLVAMMTQCFGQQIKVDQGGNQIDGSTWVTLTIKAEKSYQTANGAGAFVPSLTVRCDSKGNPGKDRRSFAILLDTGGLQPITPPSPGSGSVLLMPPKENQLRLLREAMFLRMKLDDSKPAIRKWSLLRTSDTVYSYSGDGESALLLGAGWGNLAPKKFLESVFGAKVLMIEFQPFGQENLFVSEFHPDGLRDAFQQHQECSLK